VPKSHVERLNGSDVQLGTWAFSKRRGHRDGTLPQTQIADLEAVPGWEW
jgi:hypothetical protein